MMKKKTLRAMTLFLAWLMLMLTACQEKRNSDAPSIDQPTLETPSTEESSGSVTDPLPTPGPDIEKDPALAVSELMANNSFTVADENGEYRPWIELQNISKETVSLSEYRLTVNDLSVALPDRQIAAGEYLLVFADIPAVGGLLLMHGDQISCRFSYSNPTSNRSFLVKGFAETETPTPGYQNVLDGVAVTISELLGRNTMNPVSGRLGSYIELYNPGAASLSLSDFFLSNDRNDRYLFRLPEQTLESGEYLVIMTEDIGMALSSFASELYVTRKDGVLCGSASYPDLSKNGCYTPEGYTLPTPGYSNNEEGRDKYLAARTGLLISEVITANTKTYKTDGDYYDLVELQNVTGQPLELSDYYLSDSAKEPLRYNLPAGSLAPGGYAVISLSGQANKGGSPFKLSNDGENLLVTRKDGYTEDALSVPYIPADRSWGRSNGKLVYFATPTFGKANGSGEKELSPFPIASVASGFYTETQKVTFAYEGTVYYTTDGSKPTTSSRVYKGETLTVAENTSVRMFSVLGARSPSNEICYNYFINEKDIELPIMKMTVDYDEMYGENGIFTLNYEDENGKLHYNRDEIETSVAYYIDGEEIFSLNCGLKVFGETYRVKPKKSYQLKFRAVYGTSKLKYDIFEDGAVTEFKSLVIRCGSQDYDGAMMRDEVASGLVNTFTDEVLTQNFRPITLYINDQYIGVYFIREKIDEDFVASKLNVSPESVSIVEWMTSTQVGNGDDWRALYRYIKNNDLSVEENYQYVAERLSIQSAIDYYIALTWSDNRDFSNVRFYKSTETDGKWRFIFYDTDMGFGCNGSGIYSQKYSALYVILDYYDRGSSKYDYSIIFYKLLQNKEFKEQFLTRLGEVISNELSSEKAVAFATNIRNAILHDMQYSRFISYSRWSEKTSVFVINYLSKREETFKQDYIKYFNLTEEEITRYFGASGDASK